MKVLSPVYMYNYKEHKNEEYGLNGLRNLFANARTQILILANNAVRTVFESNAHS